MKRTPADVQQEYERWDKAHEKMTATPPSEGHRYILHALSLLDLLEPIADVHPIAKVVIGCFKQLVLFEQDRRENDTRVVGVILAQTAMMRVLLDIDDLTSHQHNPTTLRAMVELPQMLHAVQEDITICHNNIDTYYKEHRLVKFCKAKDWKARMIEFIATFDRHRVELHQTLSLQVASDVNDLVSKMDILLGRLFSPHEPWELVVSDKIHNFDVGGKADWMTDIQVLRSLAVATGDLSVTCGTPSDLVETTKLEIQLNQMKDDLHLSIDVLCQRNTDLFELKLKLHTEQLERAILHSARFVIDALSGPHDRLEHEDLRMLWKEMNWMFCVETKVFGIALFEYYLDLYSDGAFTSGSVTGLWMPKFNPIHRYGSGSFKHPQAWTLLYLFVYADKIANAIDADNSGFVRISEANAFTSQIPDGWTLPQWCAYLVEGQFHEYAIYRKRLIHIRNILHELHAEILPGNRFNSAQFMFGIGATLLHYLVLEPRDPANRSKVAIAPELHELVKAKILAQDAKFREMLQSIKWTIEDESTIEVLSNGQPLETYIFPLLQVLMEFWLDLHYLCELEVLDLKEWIGPYFGIMALRQMTETHIMSLKKKFEADNDKNSKEDLRTYHRGTWALLQKTHAYDLLIIRGRFEVNLAPLLKEDYDNFYADLSFIDEFPLPEFTGLLLQRKYSTWDEYKKDKDPSTLPERQPLTWHPIDDKMNTENVNAYLDLPISRWVCDKCKKDGHRYRAMHCSDCLDFDFCRDCYFSYSPAEHAIEGHDFTHIMLVRAVWCQVTRITWLGFTARETKKRVLDFRSRERKKRIVDRIKTLISTKPGSSSENLGDKEAGHSETFHKDLQCWRCVKPIENGQYPSYICIEYSCNFKDVMLCDSCAWTNDFPEGTSHRWWHTLLPFDSRALVNNSVKVQSSPPAHLLTMPAQGSLIDTHDGDGREVSAKPSNTLLSVNVTPSITDFAGLSGVSDSVINLDKRISSLEGKVDASLALTAETLSQSQASFSAQQVSVEERMGALENRMANVEGKLDAMMGELKRGMEALLATRS